ncbi:MAG: aspartate carbamoyltransferase catalytic subunit [Chloroflexi bacterium]|nr:aspartate carbamoyltransferase catalytic subunit [Chloroflexota bacterium]
MSVTEQERRVVETPIAPPVWRHRHILDVDDFSREEIGLVFVTADAMKDILAREIKKVPTLRGKSLVTLFYEPSTRTRASFELAGKYLSADVVNVSASGSSVEKGESLLDTIHTLEALGAEVIIMRHPQSGAPYLAARNSKCSIVNAGDGWHAHPTQSLLDMYTIREKLGKLEGLRVAIVGDILHSRVARSNMWGLATMGAQVVVCGPPTLLPESFSRAFPVTVERSLERAVAGAHVVMALRLQKERQEKGLLPRIREYVSHYQINRERLAMAEPEALLMHPGPVNEGVEVSSELTRGVQSVIDTQVTNGVAVRMALLYLILGGRRPVARSEDSARPPGPDSSGFRSGEPAEGGRSQ